jgi:Protein of unknown function (DUF1566)
MQKRTGYENSQTRSMTKGEREMKPSYVFSVLGRSATMIAAVALVILAGLASSAVARKTGSVCGDGIVETGEQCDGSNLNGQTCQTQGFPEGGTLACNSTCHFNTSGCFVCGNGVVEGSEQCDGSNLNGQTCQTESFSGGTLTCNSSCALDTSGCKVRFVDNGDGTITDNQTGLMWEKKSSDGTVHDVSKTYQWSISGAPPDGGAFTSFLAELNDCESADGSVVSGGFAGHCDWRLPQNDELSTIAKAGCSTPPCVVDPAFNTDCTGGCMVTSCSCTESSNYQSASTWTDGGVGLVAWGVNFVNGFASDEAKTDAIFVRAVRGGSGS